MTTSTGVAGTTLPAQTADDYAKGDDYHDLPEAPDTQAESGVAVPGPYARMVTALPGQEDVSVIYDHERAQREMDFLLLNELLKARRG